MGDGGKYGISPSLVPGVRTLVGRDLLNGEKLRLLLLLFFGATNSASPIPPWGSVTSERLWGSEVLKVEVDGDDKGESWTNT